MIYFNISQTVSDFYFVDQMMSFKKADEIDQHVLSFMFGKSLGYFHTLHRSTDLYD